MFRKNMKKAFTLVEMLIVVIIIGILMGALLPKLKGAQERARDTARKANLTTLSTALQMYFNDEGIYPTGNCLKDISPKIVPTYISDLPWDPQKGRIAYGTKDGGCSKWDYGYTSLYRKWWENGGAVLIANTEAEWTVGNFILPQATADDKIIAIFSGAHNVTKVGTTTAISSDDAIASLTVNNMHDAAVSSDNSKAIIWAADYAEKFTCSKTTLAPKVEEATMCNRVRTPSLTDGKANSNNSMVYVLFN